MIKNKKGVSPVVATVLLIMLAIILAVIILIWAKSFMKEQITKDLGAGPQVIDSFCKEIDFVVDVSYVNLDIKLSAQNNGNVPLYGFEVKKKGTFSVKKVADIAFDGETLLSGDTREVSVTLKDPSILKTNDKLIIVPVLLGQAESGKKYYTCDDEFGKEVKI